MKKITREQAIAIEKKKLLNCNYSNFHAEAFANYNIDALIEMGVLEVVEDEKPLDKVADYLRRVNRTNDMGYIRSMLANLNLELVEKK